VGYLSGNLDLETRRKVARQEVRYFYETIREGEDPCGELNPLHRWAPEFFEIYLQQRPSEVAEEALKTAFKMWGSLRGVSERVKEAVECISCEEKIWPRAVGNGIFWSFYRDQRLEEGIALIEEIAGAIPTKTPLLFELAQGLFYTDNQEKARSVFERIIELDERKWYVEIGFAQGYVHEIDNLNIGQPGPVFSREDISGRQVDLKALRGKVVVLHFWSSTCSACHLLSLHLHRIVQRFPESQVSPVGFSKDTDSDLCRKQIKKEGLIWPQVCEGKGWQDRGFRLYNITGIPAVYVLDKAGSIAFKGGRKSGVQLEEIVYTLLS
jgi:peroxiredoxin